MVTHVYVNCTLHTDFFFCDVGIDSSENNIFMINIGLKWATNGKSSFTKSNLRTGDTTSTKVSEHHSTKLPGFLIIICSMRSINMENWNKKDCNPEEHGTKT